MDSQPRTKRMEHPQTPHCCPQAWGWPHHQLGPHWSCQVKHNPVTLLDPICKETQEDFVFRLGWHPQSYKNTSVFFLSRASEIYSLSGVTVCLRWLMQSCPARQTPAPSLNPCDCGVRSGWTQLNKSVWILIFFFVHLPWVLWNLEERLNEEADAQRGIMWYPHASNSSSPFYFVLAWKGWRENCPCSEIVPWVYFFLLFFSRPVGRIFSVWSTKVSSALLKMCPTFLRSFMAKGQELKSVCSWRIACDKITKDTDT